MEALYILTIRRPDISYAFHLVGQFMIDQIREGENFRERNGEKRLEKIRWQTRFQEQTGEMEDLISVFSNNMPEFMLANWELRSFSLENNWLTHKEFLQKAQEWWAE